MIEIAHALARQWFGFVIFPENWRYEWVVSGLASYAAYEMLRMVRCLKIFKLCMGILICLYESTKLNNVC